MIGHSTTFGAVQRLIDRIAACHAPVLIEGETGTGKEVAARAIHYGGARRDRPFVPVNCGALPDTLVESELFGHRRGAFTDARADRPGLVALAHSGTLFLDEVDALSPKAQVTLLRFLQDQQYRPLGAPREERADARIIAACNQPLHALVDAGRFRLDLLYRLQLMHVRLPPLRERPEDIPVLARHFLEIGAVRFGVPQRPIATDTLTWFQRHSWPGNIRELEHVIYRALLLCDGPVISVPPPTPAHHPAPPAEFQGGYRTAKEQAIAAFEHAYLARLIAQAEGNISVAARLAGTERRHLGRLLKKHQLGKRAFNA
jgi:DNA-binding NtrC family response regulator